MSSIKSNKPLRIACLGILSMFACSFFCICVFPLIAIRNENSFISRIVATVEMDGTLTKQAEVVQLADNMGTEIADAATTTATAAIRATGTAISRATFLSLTAQSATLTPVTLPQATSSERSTATPRATTVVLLQATPRVASTSVPTQTPLPTRTLLLTRTPLSTATLPPPTATPVPPTATPLPLPTSPPPTATSTGRETGLVTRIIDGDTIEVSMNGTSYSVRYIGIDTPETNDTCGSEATQANANLVAGQTVTMVKDVSETDSFGRLLRYIYVGDRFINGELVAGGWAVPIEYPPDTRMAGTLASLAPQGVGRGCALVAAATATEVVVVPTAPLAENCTPGYSPCIPPGPDVDCAGGNGNGPRYVEGPITVDHTHGDPYDLDRDRDNVGCE